MDVALASAHVACMSCSFTPVSVILEIFMDVMNLVSMSMITVESEVEAR